MADFCLQCANEMFGTEDDPVKSDFHKLLSEAEHKEGYALPVLCEGCGPIYVDHLGRRVDDSKNAEDENAKSKKEESLRSDS